MRRRTIAPWAFVLAIAISFLGGCSGVDWNWGWWRQPRRVVRPTVRRLPPQEERAAERSASSDDRAPEHLERAATPDAMSSPDRAPQPASPEQFGAGQSRAFFHLYLASGAAKPTDDPEHRLQLTHASARTCARVLEMLYVPVGRSGSEHDTYLLYENRAEYQAASDLAPALDVAPLKQAASTVGAEAAFRAGIGLFLNILDSGATVPPAIVDACERRFAEAAQAGSLPVVMRWASAILAGRLVSEYRYDYTGARSYYQQAERLAAKDTIALRTARWWMADAFVQEGKRKEAVTLYEEILDSTETFDTQIAQRSKAILAQQKRR